MLGLPDCQTFIEGMVDMVVGSIPSKWLLSKYGRRCFDFLFAKRGKETGCSRRATGALRLRVRKGMALTAGSECVARRMTQSNKSELIAFLTK